MSKVLENLKYATTHEWIKVEGNIGYVGISDFAQDSLGSIVYLETNNVGDNVEQFEEFGTVESVKSASELLAPVSGKILEINEDVINNPELLNEDCYKNWIIKIEIKDQNKLNKLLNASDYSVELD